MTQMTFQLHFCHNLWTTFDRMIVYPAPSSGSESFVLPSHFFFNASDVVSLAEKEAGLPAKVVVRLTACRFTM